MPVHTTDWVLHKLTELTKLRMAPDPSRGSLHGTAWPPSWSGRGGQGCGEEAPLPGDLRACPAAAIPEPQAIDVTTSLGLGALGLSLYSAQRDLERDVFIPRKWRGSWALTGLNATIHGNVLRRASSVLHVHIYE